MSVAERAFDVLSSHLRICNIFERCIQRSFEVSKIVSEKVNRSPRGSRVVSSIEDARGVFDLMNFRPTPDDLRRAQRVSEHEYDILQHDKVESVVDEKEEEEDEDEEDDDDEIRPKPGSYVVFERGVREYYPLKCISIILLFHVFQLYRSKYKNVTRITHS